MGRHLSVHLLAPVGRVAPEAAGRVAARAVVPAVAVGRRRVVPVVAPDGMVAVPVVDSGAVAAVDIATVAARVAPVVVVGQARRAVAPARWHGGVAIATGVAHRGLMTGALIPDFMPRHTGIAGCSPAISFC